jgi:hypothetical protein
MRLPLTIRSSSLGPTLECPGRLIAVPLVAPRADEEASTIGTAVHYVVARRLVDDFGAKAPEGLTQPPALALDPFAAWVVDFCLDWVRENVPSDWSLMVEVPLEYEYVLPEPVLVPLSEIDGPVPKDHEVRGDFVVIRYVICTSHVDLVALSPDGRKTVAADWKSGRIGADAADNNWQSASYLAQIRQAWPVEQAHFAMVQPLIDEDAGVERVSTVNKTGDELDALIATISERVGHAVQNRFTTNSGIYQCQYCPVCGPLCPSIRAEKEAALTMKATLTPEHIERLRAGADDATLAEFAEAGKVLTPAIKTVTEVFRDRVEKTGGIVTPRGTTVTMTDRGGTYSLTDRPKYFAELKQLIPNESDREEVLEPSMEATRKKVAKVYGIPQDSEKGDCAKKRVADRLGPFMKQSVARILHWK